jgi:hypothetical protein
MHVVKIQDWQEKEHQLYNHDLIMELLEGMDTTAAEDLIYDTVEDIAVAIGQMNALFAYRNYARLRALAHSVGVNANMLGLIKLDRLTADLIGCLERCDHNAIGALVARIQRVGEASLVAIWEMQDAL